MKGSETARSIKVDKKEQTLTLTWLDGHISVFTLEGIRRACPCVECQGGHAAMGGAVDPSIFFEPPTKDWEILRIDTVGNYGIQIRWLDGHDTGIYRWSFLREVCPCPACRPEFYTSSPV